MSNHGGDLPGPVRALGNPLPRTGPGGTPWQLPVPQEKHGACQHRAHHPGVLPTCPLRLYFRPGFFTLPQYRVREVRLKDKRRGRLPEAPSASPCPPPSVSQPRPLPPTPTPRALASPS